MTVLSINFFTLPHVYRQTMTKKELKEVLLDTGGRIFACGRRWDIKSKHLGAGVYEVFLKECL